MILSRVVGLSFVVFALTAAAQPEREILSFHRPDTEIAPVEAPDWVLDGVLKSFITPFPNADLACQQIDEAAARGIIVVHTGGLQLYYPLRADNPSSGMSADLVASLRTVVARAKSHHLRIVVGVDPFAPIEMVRAHPDWMIHPTDDAAIEAHAREDLTQPANLGYRNLNLNSPFGEYAAKCIAEMVRDFEIDGVSFDGNYHPAIDFGPLQKTLYTTETGRPFPKAATLEDLDYRVYLLWAGDKLEAFYTRLRDSIRAVRPDAAVYTWSANAGRYGHFLMLPPAMPLRLNRLIDAPLQEWWMDESNLGSSIVPAFGAAYARAASGHRIAASEPYLVSRGDPYGVDSIPTREVVLRAMLALTNGSYCPFGGTNPNISDTPRAAYEAMKARAPWVVRAQPMPWAAVLVSERTREFFAYRDPIGNSMAHAFGVFRAAYEEHLPITLITESDLTMSRLRDYSVLVLPNAACLSDDQLDVIRSYVSAGGGLVATCETSLLDGLGRPRADFGLADLFGVHYKGRAKAPRVETNPDAPVALDDTFWGQRTAIGAFRFGGSDIATKELIDDDRLRALVPSAQVNIKAPVVRISAPEPPMKNALIFFPQNDREPFPIVSMGPHGSGRVVYFGAGVDHGYFTYGYPYQRRMLARAIQWAATNRFPIDVQAPMCVQATYFRQQDARGTRIIVHLFNDLNTASDHGRPDQDVPLREEGVPIGSIAIRVTGLRIAQCHIEPGGSVVTPEPDGAAQVYRVPPLDLHAMAVLEMQ